MTDLTPEAVKDMMYHHERGRAHNNTGFTRLELNSMGLAREYLRLKEVEKAGEALADLIKGDLVGSEWKRECRARVAAFRAAVEGK